MIEGGQNHIKNCEFKIRTSWQYALCLQCWIKVV